MDLPLFIETAKEIKNFNLRTKEADAGKFLFEASLIHRLPLFLTFFKMSVCVI